MNIPTLDEGYFWEKYDLYSILKDEDIVSKYLDMTYNFILNAGLKAVLKKVLFAGNPYVFISDTASGLQSVTQKHIYQKYDNKFIKFLIFRLASEGGEIKDELITLILFVSAHAECVVSNKNIQSEYYLSPGFMTSVGKGLLKSIVNLNFNKYSETIMEDQDKEFDKNAQYFYTWMIQSILVFLIHLEHYLGETFLEEHLTWLSEIGFNWFTDSASFTNSHIKESRSVMIPKSVPKFGGETIRKIYCTISTYDSFFKEKYLFPQLYDDYITCIKALAENYYDPYGKYKAYRTK